jgi:translation initiation factor IF-3
VKHAIKFLEEGAKVKAYVHFKGRTIAYKEKGEIILLKFAQELEDFGKVEQLPKLEGNRMFLYLVPIPGKKPKKPAVEVKENGKEKDKEKAKEKAKEKEQE